MQRVGFIRGGGQRKDWDPQRAHHLEKDPCASRLTSAPGGVGVCN